MYLQSVYIKIKKKKINFDCMKVGFEGIFT